MTYYIVKSTHKATESNPKFPGMTSIGYFGKDQHLLGREGSAHDYLGDSFKVTPYMVKAYGYKRRCDAARSWIYRNVCSSLSWDAQVEIVAVEV